MQEYSWESKSSAEPRPSSMEKAAEQTKRLQLRAGSALRGSAYAICVVAIILLEILRRFVTGTFNTEFAWDYVFAALISSLGSMLTFYIFFPCGKNEGRAKKAFMAAYNLIQQAIQAVGRHALRTEFRAYCRQRAQDEAREALEDRLLALEDLGVTRSEYEERWKVANKKSLKAAVRSGEISEEAKKQILLCRKVGAALPYSPLYFLAGADEKKQNKYLRGGSHHELRALIRKPISVVLIAVVQSSFTIGVTGAENGFEVFLAIVMSVFQICLSAFMGYFAGYGVAEKDIEVNLAKAGFMMDFLEARGVKIDDTEKKDIETAPR